MTNTEKIKQLEKQNEEIQATLKDLLDHNEMHIRRWNKLVQDMQIMDKFMQYTQEFVNNQSKINNLILNAKEKAND